MMPRLFVFATLVTGLSSAGCMSEPMTNAASSDSTAAGSTAADSTAPMGDRAEVYGDPVATPDLVRDGALTLSGTAVFDTVTVAEWTAWAATSPAEAEAAERMAASGAYLGDPVRTVRLAAGTGEGTATHALAAPLDGGFETEFLHRFHEAAGRVAFTISGPTPTGGRAMPSVFQVAFDLGAEGGTPGVVASLGDDTGPLSELARAELPAGLDPLAFAHRFAVRYTPGTVTVALDGAPVLEETIRLGTLDEAAVAAHTEDAGRAHLLRWTLNPTN